MGKVKYSKCSNCGVEGNAKSIRVFCKKEKKYKMIRYKYDVNRNKWVCPACGLYFNKDELIK